MMFQGTYTALITPFTATGDFDENAFSKLLDLQIEGGVDGLVPIGTTGESPTLTSNEIYRVLQLTVEAAKGRMPVIVGTGSNCTTKAIEQTKIAKEVGADAALVVCPYYNKPTQKGLILHYEAIAEATRFPIIIYNIKGRTGINMSTNTLMELAKNTYIVGVKEASGDLVQMKEVLSSVPRDFSVLSGDDALTLELVKMGGHGVISVASNLIPARMSKFVKMVLNKQWSEAEQEQGNLRELFETLFIETNPLPIKTALALGGYCQEVFRLPLCPMTEVNKQKLSLLLKKYSL